MYRHLTIVAAVLAALAGCGQNSITEGEAEEGWRVVSGPLNAGQERIQKRTEELGAEIAFRDEPVTATSNCGDSGDVRFELEVSIEGDGASPSDPAVNFTSALRSCEALDSTVLGGLDIEPPDSFGRPSGGGGGGGSRDAGTGDADAGGRSSNAVGYEGELFFSGDVDGTCEVDMVVNPSESGQPTYSGTWCGHDADDVVGFSLGR